MFEDKTQMVKGILNYVKISLYFFGVRKQRLNIKEKKLWKKKFLYFLNHIRKENSDYEERWKIIKGFVQSDLRILKKAKDKKNDKDPILICVMLNEIDRVKVFMKHYREIGIKKFAILDNGSTDGTIDYLKKQSDVDLFQTKDKFESKIKVGWINRIISYYGTSHWYLAVDADELLVWQNVENDNIRHAIGYLNKKGILRARALMVDMYPQKVKWNSNDTFEKIYPECRYFDYNTYYMRKTNELYLLCGGPRSRKLGIEAWLTKYPLFKLRGNEFFCNPHVIYPYDNRKSSCYFAILHYKFLTRTDRMKIRKYAKMGNYACDSAEYKTYLRKQRERANNFHFYYDQSAAYESSCSLTKIKQINRIPYWK